MSKYYIDTYKLSRIFDTVISCYCRRQGYDPLDYSVSYFDSVLKAKESAEQTAKSSGDYQPEIIFTLSAAILLEKELEEIQT